MTAPSLTALMHQHWQSAAAEALRQQRLPLYAALQESERQHAATLPGLERDFAAKLKALREAEAKVEALRGPAYTAEHALQSERTRASRERDDLRRQLRERAHPHLQRLHAATVAMLRANTAFAPLPPPPTEKRVVPGNRPVTVVKPGYVPPRSEIELTRDALERLGLDMETAEQDVAAIEARFFAALPGAVGQHLRAALQHPAPTPAR